MTNSNDKQQKNRKVGIYLAVGVLLMFGFGYLLVPFYNVICKTLGINGKTSNQQIASATTIDKSRTIEVQFLATINTNLRHWKFYPETKRVMVHPGQNTRIAYFAENDTNHTMTVQAIPSVSPGLAANYLLKTECFCFTQQTLKAHEKMDMPLLFHLDRDLPKNISVVTLSYTLFDVTGQKTRNKKNKGRIG